MTTVIHGTKYFVYLPVYLTGGSSYKKERLLFSLLLLEKDNYAWPDEPNSRIFAFVVAVISSLPGPMILRGS